MFYFINPFYVTMRHMLFSNKFQLLFSIFYSNHFHLSAHFQKDMWTLIMVTVIIVFRQADTHLATDLTTQFKITLPLTLIFLSIFSFTCKETVADCDTNNVEEDEQDLANLILAQFHLEYPRLIFAAFLATNLKFSFESR